MALIATVGGSTSDTYGTLAEANAYFASRQSTGWTGSDTDKEMALRKAASYLDNKFRTRWKGVKVSLLQSLAWPRAGVKDSDGYLLPVDSIPQRVKNAQFEAANIILGGTELEATINPPVKTEKVGPIEVVYAAGASPVPTYPQINNWLSDLVTGAGVMVRG